MRENLESAFANVFSKCLSIGDTRAWKLKQNFEPLEFSEKGSDPLWRFVVYSVTITGV